jgi:hypothetical protein
LVFSSFPSLNYLCAADEEGRRAAEGGADEEGRRAAEGGQGEAKIKKIAKNVVTNSTTLRP